MKLRSRSPSPQTHRVRAYATTPIKAPQRITVSPAASPVSVKLMHPFTSRLVSTEQRVTVEMLEAQERQRVATLPQLSWANQLEVLRGMKNQLEIWGKTHPAAEMNPDDVSQNLFHTTIQVVMENLTKAASSSVIRVTSVGLEVMHLVVVTLISKESVGLLTSVIHECVKSLLNQSFMNADNSNSRLVTEIVNRFIAFQHAGLNEQFIILFTHMIQFSINFTTSILLRFLITISSLHPALLSSRPDLLRSMIESCYQCILNNSTVLLRLVRDLLSQLSQANTQETGACVQSLSTSKRIVLVEFAEKSKLDESVVSLWKSSKRSPIAESDHVQLAEATLSKPAHFQGESRVKSRIPSRRAESGNSDLSTTNEDIEEPSLPRSVSVIPIQKKGLVSLTPKKLGSQMASQEETAYTRLRLGRGGKQELDCIVDALAKRQFCTLSAFNQLWNSRSPFLVWNAVLLRCRSNIRTCFPTGHHNCRNKIRSR